MIRRLAIIALATLLAAGCDKDEEVDPPAELVDVQPSIHVEKLWSTGIGDSGEHLRIVADHFVEAALGDRQARKF